MSYFVTLFIVLGSSFGFSCISIEISAYSSPFAYTNLTFCNRYEFCFKKAFMLKKDLNFANYGLSTSE